MKIDDATLMSYVDGELGPEAARQVEAALRASPAARAKVAMFRLTSKLVRCNGAERLYESGSSSAHYALLLSHDARRRLYRAAAVACLLSAGAGFAASRYIPPSSLARDELVTEVAEYFKVYSQETTHLVEVGADRKAEIIAWLSARVGRHIEPPALDLFGLTFAGARMLVVDSKPVAQLVYTRRNGPPIALCLTPFESKPGLRRTDRQNDQDVVSLYDGQFAYLVVGDLEPSSAIEIAYMASEHI